MQDGQTSNCNQIEIDNSNWLQNRSNLQQVIMIIDRNQYRNKNFAEYCFFWYKSRMRRGLNLQKSAFFLPIQVDIGAYPIVQYAIRNHL